MQLTDQQKMPQQAIQEMSLRQKYQSIDIKDYLFQLEKKEYVYLQFEEKAKVMKQ
jgi:hypothetical protein